MQNDRLLKLKEQMQEKGLESFLISNPKNIFYLTGLDSFQNQEKEAFLLATKNQTYLFTDQRYLNGIKNQSLEIELVKTSNFSLPTDIRKLLKKSSIKNLAFEARDITFTQYQSLKKALFDLKLVASENIVERLRIIKNDYEITCIKKACQITDQVFSRIVNFIKLGKTEKEIAEKIEFFIKKSEAVTAFYPIVAFGKNSATPHHRSGDKKLEKKDRIILLDFGARYKNYCSDITRVIFLGKIPDNIKKIYQTVLSAQEKAIELIAKKEIKAEKLHSLATKHIVSQGFPDMIHSLGHGVGIDIHELPKISIRSEDQLLPGMVFTIEPGIYLENLGGIRIEDTVLLTASGPQILTKAKKQIIKI